MRNTRVFCFAVLSLLLVSVSHAEDEPRLTGYVTRVGTSQDFDVNGQRVVCDAKTTVKQGHSNASTPGCPAVEYGERLTIIGVHSKKTAAITASEIDLAAPLTGRSLSGLAVVDDVLAKDILRADGFAIRVFPSTTMDRRPPLAMPGDFHVGEWVRYEGKLDKDGVIEATRLIFEAPAVTAREQKLRDKNEYDPSAVAPEDRQSPLGKFFLGTNVKRLPASPDAQQQQRVERIGQRLVPAFQKKLASADPNRLHFRFQLVESNMRGCMVLPNGITLVTDRAAALLTEDAELAAVLSACIADALEKQGYRYLAANSILTATSLAATAASIFVPFAGLASIPGGVAAHNDSKNFSEQTARTSLVLLHDAGFDIRLAPMAWWRLSTKKEDFLRHSPPSMTQYLFQDLTTLWGPNSPLARPLSQTGANIEVIPSAKPS